MRYDNVLIFGALDEKGTGETDDMYVMCGFVGRSKPHHENLFFRFRAKYEGGPIST